MPGQTDLNARIVIRAEDRTDQAVRRTRQGLRSISEGLERVQRAAQGALLAGGVFEALRRGVGAAGSSPRGRGTPPR